MEIYNKIDEKLTEIAQDVEYIKNLKNQVGEKIYILSHMLAEANSYEDITDEEYEKYMTDLDNIEDSM